MNSLKNRKILVGVTGGIAAYKSCILIRQFKKAGAEVRVILTKSGSQFITPVTLEALSGNPVAMELFESSKTVQHIDIARWADEFVIAPATANCLAKAANGIADDLLSTIMLSFEGSIIFAPAMNDKMWENAATQQNLKTLIDRDHRMVEPGEGELACDTVGKGRMAEPEEIFEYVMSEIAKSHDLAGKRILITAGGTQEAIDPVRFITNRSSGKMGFAFAEEAVSRGAEVTLIVGTYSAPLPEGIEILEAKTAAEMTEAVKMEFGACDILIMAAAVADYRPEMCQDRKIKKSEQSLELKLEPTEDILLSLKSVKREQFVIGFSLETENGEANALKKLKEKALDMIILNNPNDEGAAFEVDTNRVTIFSKDGKKEELPLLSKREVARRILDKVVKLAI